MTFCNVINKIWFFHSDITLLNIISKLQIWSAYWVNITVSKLLLANQKQWIFITVFLFLSLQRQVAQALLKHEVLTYEDIEGLIGQRPYPNSRKQQTIS